MAARATWTGAIRLAGFPVNVTFWQRVKTRKSESFKMLDPVHKQPVQSVLLDVAGNRVERSETLRGVERGKEVYELPPEALEMIERREKSSTVEIDRFSELDSVPLELSLDSYYIVPDAKTPGSEDPVQILWNGLHATGRVAVVPGWCPRSGAKPSTLVIRATDEGLVGYLMPFRNEVNVPPADFMPNENEQAVAVMTQFIDAAYSTEAFDMEAYRDEHGERRQAAIDMALSGETTAPLSESPQPTSAVPNLMAALQASIDAQPAKKTPAKKAPAKRAPAKKKAAA